MTDNVPTVRPPSQPTMPAIASPSRGRAAVLPPFALGFDCLEPFRSEGEVHDFRDAADWGFVYAGRYLENLTQDEVGWLHGVGWSVLLFCEARVSPLSGETGIEDGTRELRRLRELETPRTVCATIDLEAAHGAPSDVDAHTRAMSRLLVQGGYSAPVYVGDRCVLDGKELYALPDVHGYLASPSSIPEPACGYLWRQFLPLEWTGHGKHRAVDVGLGSEDRRGRRLVVWAP